MPEQLLDGPTIKAHVGEVADQISDDGEQRTLVLVGGALLAWYGMRVATRDVDSVRRLDDEPRSRPLPPATTSHLAG